LACALLGIRNLTWRLHKHINNAFLPEINEQGKDRQGKTRQTTKDTALNPLFLVWQPEAIAAAACSQIAHIRPLLLA
jgi:hypothetical protein